MYDIVPTKFICECDGKIDLYLEENNSDKFYYKCRTCGNIYSTTEKFRANGCVDKYV